MHKKRETQSSHSCVFEEDELPHMLAIFSHWFCLAKYAFDDERESWDSCFQLKTSSYVLKKLRLKNIWGHLVFYPNSAWAMINKEIVALFSNLCQTHACLLCVDMSWLLCSPVPSGKTHALNPYPSAIGGKSVYLQCEVFWVTGPRTFLQGLYFYHKEAHGLHPRIMAQRLSRMQEDISMDKGPLSCYMPVIGWHEESSLQWTLWQRHRWGCLRTFSEVFIHAQQSCISESLKGNTSQSMSQAKPFSRMFPFFQGTLISSYSLKVLLSCSQKSE